MNPTLRLFISVLAASGCASQAPPPRVAEAPPTAAVIEGFDGAGESIFLGELTTPRSPRSSSDAR